ncbi:MAG: DUF4350 domain-containing protein [Deltaproteobacteria bacterium]|nr:DUF4350 domain-containing protein [Deltaproteobacteria bacterium]MBW2302448.1 DUF4350 domain-containing protein [Deltaproteobacteria bacterium]
MRNARKIPWVKTALLWGGLFLAVYGLVMIKTAVEGPQGLQRPTSYFPGPGGYKALYLWLKGLGLPVKRWEQPPDRLAGEVSVLLIVEPELVPEGRELEALTGWVRKGGTLILAVGRPKGFLSCFGFELAPPTGTNGGGVTKGLPAFQPGPYTLKVSSIQGGGHLDLVTKRPEAVLHCRDRWGGLLAAVREGKGQVIALADPTLFSNILLGKADHARLALNLALAHLGQGALCMDEYYHGYGRAASVWEHLFTSSAAVPLLQAVIFLLVLWAATGRRFGPARSEIKEEARSSMEYVKAVARLLQKAGAGALALELLARRAEEEAERLLLNQDEVLLKRIRKAREGGGLKGISDRELTRRAGELHDALMEARRRGASGKIRG